MNLEEKRLLKRLISFKKDSISHRIFQKIALRTSLLLVDELTDKQKDFLEIRQMYAQTGVPHGVVLDLIAQYREAQLQLIIGLAKDLSDLTDLYAQSITDLTPDDVKLFNMDSSMQTGLKFVTAEWHENNRHITIIDFDNCIFTEDEQSTPGFTGIGYDLKERGDKNGFGSLLP